MKTKKTLRFNNTYRSGTVTFIIFKKGNKFTAVCLEFDLTAEGKTFKEAKELIEDYAQLWYQNAVKNKLPEEVLNRPAERKYWDMYEHILQEQQNRIINERKKEVISNSNNLFVASFLPYTSKFPTMAYC